MAGDWIKMRVGLHDEPEVIAISMATSLDEDAVVGRLLRLWGWADQKSIDGTIPNVQSAWVDRRMSCDGFAAAMVAVGWLEETPDGLKFPGFSKHNGNTAKRRASHAQQAAERRGKNRREGGVSNSCAQDAHTAATECLPREEKRREEKSDKENPPLAPQGEKAEPFRAEDYPIPESLDTPEFREAWLRWCAFRRKKRNPVSEDACQKQMPKMAEAGVEASLQAIEDSISNDWKGLFPKKPRAGPKAGGNLLSGIEAAFLEANSHES